MSRFVTRSVVLTALSLLGLAVGTAPASAQSPPLPDLKTRSVSEQATTTTQRPAPRPAARPAASSKSKWQFEVHGGLLGGANPSGGTATLPGPGAGFITAFGFPSRQITSWYFGDGNLLFNQFNTAIGLTSNKITSLDPSLSTAATSRGRAPSVGVRVSRSLTPRLSAEFNLDAGMGGLELTPTALTNINDSMNTFKAAWLNTFGFEPGFQVSSTATTVDKQGRQVFLTGAIVYDISQRISWTPYVTLGLGLAHDSGDDSVALVGDYRFLSSGANPKHETDTVTVRYTSGNSFVTVLGGGLKHNVSRNAGIRLDLRAYLSSNTSKILLSAKPTVAHDPPQTVLGFSFTPSIQFSAIDAFPSTLSGPTLTDTQTFAGSGMRVQFGATFGYFMRF